MKIRLALTLLALVGGPCASASAQTWRIGDDQPFPIHISDLPVARQRSILGPLEPSLEQRAKEFDLEPGEIEIDKKALLVRWIATPTGTLTLIQGWGPDLCGATGNCKMWVLGKGDRLLLDGQAYRLKVLKTTHRGLPSIVTYSSWTGDGAQLIRYSFDGTKYRPLSCATERVEFMRKVYSKPQLEYGPCDE